MDWSQVIVTIVCSVVSSSGAWAFLEKKRSDKDYSKMMLKGLGHNLIVELGNKYIERGWLTIDEYENLVDYLYGPYEKIGGNGSGKRIIDQVKSLPVYSSESAYYKLHGGDKNA